MMVVWLALALPPLSSAPVEFGGRLDGVPDSWEHSPPPPGEVLTPNPEPPGELLASRTPTEEAEHKAAMMWMRERMHTPGSGEKEEWASRADELELLERRWRREQERGAGADGEKMRQNVIDHQSLMQRIQVCLDLIALTQGTVESCEVRERRVSEAFSSEE